MNQKGFKKEILKKFHKYLDLDYPGNLVTFQGRSFNFENEFDPEGNLFINDTDVKINFKPVIKDAYIQSENFAAKLNLFERRKLVKKLEQCLMKERYNKFLEQIGDHEDIRDDLEHLCEDVQIRQNYTDVMEAYKEYKTLVNLYRDK